MSDQSDSNQSSRSEHRLYIGVTPSDTDLARARSLKDDACPRRYCWWWRGLSFEWEIAPSNGCMFLTAPKPKYSKGSKTPCCRSDVHSHMDHYEPREPDIIEDGMEVEAERWLEAAKLRWQQE